VLDDARAVVRRLLAANRDLVEALRDALLERHELVGDEITDVLDAALAARVAPTPASGLRIA
jgi:ATP-dependent Zn protease